MQKDVISVLDAVHKGFIWDSHGYRFLTSPSPKCLSSYIEL